LVIPTRDVVKRCELLIQKIDDVTVVLFGFKLIIQGVTKKAS